MVVIVHGTIASVKKFTLARCQCYAICYRHAVSIYYLPLIASLQHIVKLRSGGFDLCKYPLGTDEKGWE